MAPDPGNDNRPLPDDGDLTRRAFLRWTTGAAVGLGLTGCESSAKEGVVRKAPGPSKVVIARDDKLQLGQGREDVSQQAVVKLLNETLVRLTGQKSAKAAWASLFKPTDVVGLKVNCLGRVTRPEVVYGIVECLIAAGLPAGQIIIWDRSDRELRAAKYRLNRGGSDVQCHGTDALGSGFAAGYERTIRKSGRIGSFYSQIVAKQCSALISVPVLKDHNLAGLSGGMKNFYGAIHNPNKYHDDNCDPFVADVVAHPYIREKLRLVVCDATTAQYNGGPTLRPQWSWPFNGLLVGTDAVAVDRVAVERIEQQRRAKKMKSLADDGRPATYLQSAQRAKLGTADLARIEQITV